MFSAFWAMLGGPLFWMMLFITGISGIFNFLQYGWSSYKTKEIDSLRQELVHAKTLELAAQTQADSIKVQCERLARYYENMPVKKTVDGDIDPDAVIKWLRNQNPGNKLSPGGETDNPKSAKNP